MKDKIINLIETIPEEVKDCFGVMINENEANMLMDEYNRMLDSSMNNSGEPLRFPCYIMNVPVGIGRSSKMHLEPIRVYEKLNKLYHYEYDKFTKFMNELNYISNKYGCSVDGCGCCGSPGLIGFHTFYVDYLNYDDKEHKYTYDFRIAYEELGEK